MKAVIRFCVIPILVCATQSMALSLAPEEFEASRKMACVLAQESLGQLSETEYGEKANTLLDGFDETERDHILAQAVGYFGGVIFSPVENDADRTTVKLEDFVSSSTCLDDYRKVTFNM